MMIKKIFLTMIKSFRLEYTTAKKKSNAIALSSLYSQSLLQLFFSGNRKQQNLSFSLFFRKIVFWDKKPALTGEPITIS